MYKGSVRPRYVDAKDPELLALAEQLIELFDQHEGRPRFELDRELADLVGSGTDFMLHRAFAKLLFDRCTFDTESAVEPDVLRRRLFETAAAAYRSDAVDEKPFHFDRHAVLADAAQGLEVDPAEVEHGLYADLKDEQVLGGWRRCRPEWLVARYNVALAQGVLLRATELEIHLTETSVTKQRALFRAIKFFRLLHRVTEDGKGGWKIRLDGPMSVFKASGKYGVQMASFLPTLLHFSPWTLEAKVRWGKARRAATFSLASDQGLEPYGPLRGQWQPEEVAWLPEQLAKVTDAWEVSSDAAVIPLGGQGVLIPDFVFTHRESGFEVVMEILGFWRKGALESRLKLLRRHGPPHMIVAVSKQLVAEEGDLDDLPGEVYLFRSAPLARQVAKHLERLRVG